MIIVRKVRLCISNLHDTKIITNKYYSGLVSTRLYFFLPHVSRGPVLLILDKY